MKQLTVKQLVLIDLVCAFAGSVFFLVLFDFLINTLALPRTIVLVQLTANTLYGIIGLFIFLSKKFSLFRSLILMNFCYAVFCLIVGLILPATTIEGAILILAEGTFIFYLALFERRSLRKVL
jgi:hypothetical protein